MDWYLYDSFLLVAFTQAHTFIQVPFLNLSTVSIPIDNLREEANHQPLQPTANSISWATATHN